MNCASRQPKRCRVIYLKGEHVHNWVGGRADHKKEAAWWRHCTTCNLHQHYNLEVKEFVDTPVNQSTVKIEVTITFTDDDTGQTVKLTRDTAIKLRDELNRVFPSTNHWTSWDKPGVRTPGIRKTPLMGNLCGGFGGEVEIATDGLGAGVLYIPEEITFQDDRTENEFLQQLMDAMAKPLSDSETQAAVLVICKCGKNGAPGCHCMEWCAGCESTPCNPGRHK